MGNRHHIHLQGSRADPLNVVEDFGDRLNCVYTALLTLILAIVTLANTYFLRPISCSTPASMEHDLRGYAEHICSSQGVIAISGHDAVPARNVDWAESSDDEDISFYQWVPFCLLIQAAMFHLPHLIWTALSNSSFGDNLSYLLTRAKVAASSDDPVTKRKLVRACADQLYVLSRQHFNTSTSLWSRMQEALCSRNSYCISCTVKKRMCNHSAVFYLLVKLLYIFNCIGQIFLSIHFLGVDNSTRSSVGVFSEKLLSLAASRRKWDSSKHFPHQTLCHIRLPHMGFQTHTAVCALPANILNEKIYVFLWIWFLAVLAVNLTSTAAWMWRLLIKAHSNSYLRSFLYVSLLAPPSFEANDPTGSTEAISTEAYRTASLEGALVERFLTEVVGCEGNFLIRTLRLNAGVIVTGEILVTWWKLFKAMEGAGDSSGGGCGGGADEGEIAEISEYGPMPPRTFAEMPDASLEERLMRRTLSYI